MKKLFYIFALIVISIISFKSYSKTARKVVASQSRQQPVKNSSENSQFGEIK